MFVNMLFKNNTIFWLNICIILKNRLLVKEFQVTVRMSKVFGGC